MRNEKDRITNSEKEQAKEKQQTCKRHAKDTRKRDMQNLKVAGL
jgi:hypothetical protein